MFGTILSRLTWGLVILLAGPTLAILATWNTLPGEPLYPIKRGLENTALLILSPSFQARATLQTELIDRRTTEATKVLTSRNSTEGLNYLTTQIVTAKMETIEAKDPQEQRQAAQKLIAQLQQTNQELEKAKQAYQPPTYQPPTPTPTPPPSIQLPTYPPQTYPPPAQPTPTPRPTLTPTPRPTPTPTPRPSTGTTTPAPPPPTDVANQINQTQYEIQTAINDLQQVAQAAEEKHQQQEEQKQIKKEERHQQREERRQGREEHGKDDDD